MHPECLFQVAQMQYTVKEWLYCPFPRRHAAALLDYDFSKQRWREKYYGCAAFLRMNLEPNHWVTVRTDPYT